MAQGAWAFGASGQDPREPDGVDGLLLPVGALVEVPTGRAGGSESLGAAAATYPLAEVRQAFEQLESGHIRGKIVLLP